MPGTMLLDHFFGLKNPDTLVPVFFLTALATLLLAIFTGFVRDSEPEPLGKQVRS
jgi:hypothetical protein